MAALEFFYDFNSPYSFLASTQLAALAARTGARIVYRPFVLGGVFKEASNSSPALVPAKYRYMAQDLARWAARYGVRLVYKDPLAFKSIFVLRAALAAEEQGKIVPFTDAAFRAYWSEERDLARPEELSRVIASVGLDPGAILSRIEQQDIKERLRAQTEEAVRRGAFGAPTFFVGDQMFWGNDRLDFVEEALRAAV